MRDIHFDMEGNRRVRCRAAGVLVRDGMVLLQTDGTGEYAFPGGGIAFGETGAETVAREFAEEIGAAVTVGALCWMEEVLFSWGGAVHHLFCLSYCVTLREPASIPLAGTVPTQEAGSAVTFHWIPLERVRELTVYPEQAHLWLAAPDAPRHAIYRPEGMPIGGDLRLRGAPWDFGCRAAGILIHGGRVLLHRVPGEEAYALPGGGICFGETGAEALARELAEETGAAVTVGALRWVEEGFIPLEGRMIHQIGLYYAVTLPEDAALASGDAFTGVESMEGRTFPLEFEWVPLEQARTLRIYPLGVAAWLGDTGSGIRHFIYREKEQG